MAIPCARRKRYAGHALRSLCADSLDRPGWQRVMGAVHGRQVGAVLIAKLDRCTRSVADLASLIDAFSRRGVALISAAESLDTSSAGGRLVVNVLGAVAQ